MEILGMAAFETQKREKKDNIDRLASWVSTLIQRCSSRLDEISHLKDCTWFRFSDNIHCLYIKCVNLGKTTCQD